MMRNRLGLTRSFLLIVMVKVSQSSISWTGCTWIDGDANGSNEQSIGSINSPAECVAICRTHLINGQKANVATVTSDGKSCFCETGATPISPSVGSYKHCFIRELSGEACDVSQCSIKAYGYCGGTSPPCGTSSGKSCEYLPEGLSEAPSCASSSSACTAVVGNGDWQDFPCSGVDAFEVSKPCSAVVAQSTGGQNPYNKFFPSGFHGVQGSYDNGRHLGDALGSFRVQCPLPPTDPVFSFIPKVSLSSVFVQDAVTLEIDLLKGTFNTSTAVFEMHGPFFDGHAGMTVSNFVAISKGDNLNITEYDQNGTRTASMPDGLYDTSTLNYTSLGRQQRDNTFEDQNRLKLEGTLVMVDHPLVDGNGTMWIWASAEISDEYVWVGEEAVNVSRKASDRPYLNHTLELKQYREPLVAGERTSLAGSFSHLPDSRKNAYDVTIRVFFPPYAEYITNTFRRDPLYSTGDTVLVSASNMLAIKFIKVGITDKPSFTIDIHYNTNNYLNLIPGEGYNGTIHYMYYYCGYDRCLSAGMENHTNELYPSFMQRKAEDLGNFQISHVPSGRCWSYTAGQNSEQIILKGDCADEFTYDTYGGLKHVLSSRCTYIDGTTNYTKMQTSCDDWTVALIHKDIIGLMMIKPKSTNKAVMADGFGNEGEYIGNETVSASTEQQNAFRFLPALPDTPVTLTKKLVLYSTSGSLLFFCCRHHDRTKPSCFYSNISSQGGWRALPAALGNIKGYNPTTHLLYGIDSRGVGHMEVDLNKSPLKVSQIDESHWTARSTESIQSHIISQSSLGDSLTAIPNTSEYSYNLRGIYCVKTQTTPKLIVRWC